MPDKIIADLKKELAKYADRKYRVNAAQFDKDKTERWVLRAPIVRAVSKEKFRELKALPKRQILDLCDRILESDLEARRFFAFDWADKLERQYEKTDFSRFERWLKAYVENWGHCDHLGTGPMGKLVYRFPELIPKVMKWTRSKNMWLRRASAVTLIVPVRHRQNLDDVFKTADILLEDSEDLVQKGYGWMLKVAGDRFPDEVFAYVLANKSRMPRTALRYAIEKFPQSRRKQAMARD